MAHGPCLSCIILTKSRVQNTRFSKPEGLLLVICDATNIALPKAPAITVYTDGTHYQSVVAQHISDLIPDRASFKPYKYLHSNELMGRAVTQPPKDPKIRPAQNTCSQCRVTLHNNLPANIQLLHRKMRSQQCFANLIAGQLALRPFQHVDVIIVLT